MTQWIKGQSGNPGGRPKEIAEVRDLSRQHTPEALATLLAIMRNADAKDAARVAAAKELLDRGWGKPAGEAPQVAIQINNEPMDTRELARLWLHVLEDAKDKQAEEALTELVPPSHAVTNLEQ